MKLLKTRNNDVWVSDYSIRIYFCSIYILVPFKEKEKTTDFLLDEDILGIQRNNMLQTERDKLFYLFIFIFVHS